MSKKEKKIEEIIIKFLNREANIDELHQLGSWLENPKNDNLFLGFIKDNAYTNIAMSEYNIEDAKKNIVKRIEAERAYRKSVFSIKNVLRITGAAACIALFVTVYFMGDGITEHTVDTKVSNKVNTISPGTDKATLTLEDGSEIVLEGKRNYETQNAKSDGEQIIYKSNAQKAREIKYNYLTIPRGGQFSLVLSDGTKVWLNSESQLKYPVHFEAGKTRQVELVYGEAYFDVVPSKAFQGSKFSVLNQSQEVEVLGTAFNIKAYKDEYHIYTTLVEGLVTVSNGISSKSLVPEQQAHLDLEKNAFSVAKVDVRSEVSWINGVFSFKNKSLKEIMKVISRWYDVDVIFENKDLETLKFRGVLEKNMELEEVLSIMKSSTINKYEITEKTIRLK